MGIPSNKRVARIDSLTRSKQNITIDSLMLQKHCVYSKPRRGHKNQKGQNFETNLKLK